MLGRAVGAVLIVMLASVAGCISRGDDAVEEAANDTLVENVLEANETTEAPDGRGEISAFKETNKTEMGTGGDMHSHDYWGDKTRIDLLSETMWFIPLPAWPCRSGNAPDGDCYNPGTSIADIDLPAPTLVYEGTGSIEVLFKDYCIGPTEGGECVPNPQVKMGFDYLTAADEPGQWRTYGFVEPGTPVVIPVKPEEADMPHQAKSFWLFRIYTEYATSVTFNFTVTAVKGNAVVDWPPHPDLYAETSTRLIFDGPVHGEYAGDVDNNLYGTDATWTFPERIISYGTESLQVEIEKGTWGASWPEPAAEEWILEVNNASYIPKVGNGAPAGYQLEPVSIDGTKYVFDIPVDAAGYDTPYGQHSRWSFRFVPAEDHGLPWAVDYTMKITATGHSVAEEALPR